MKRNQKSKAVVSVTHLWDSYIHLAALTEEEKYLESLFVKVRATRKALREWIQTQRSSEVTGSTKAQRKSIKRCIVEAEEATKEIKRRVMSGAINLEKAVEKVVFKRSKHGKSKFGHDNKDFVTENSESPTTTAINLCMDSDDKSCELTHVTTLCIRGYNLEDEKLKQAFSEFGEVKSICVEEHRRTAFLAFGSVEEVEQAIYGMDGNMIDGITVRVSLAQNQNKKHQESVVESMSEDHFEGKMCGSSGASSSSDDGMCVLESESAVVTGDTGDCGADMAAPSAGEFVESNSNSGTLTSTSPSSDIKSDARNNKVLTLHVRGQNLNKILLENIFKCYGTIRWLRLEKHLGSAFLTMANNNEALDVIREVDGKEIDGNVMSVSFARCRSNSLNSAEFDPSVKRHKGRFRTNSETKATSDNDDSSSNDFADQESGAFIVTDKNSTGHYNERLKLSRIYVRTNDELSLGVLRKEFGKYGPIQEIKMDDSNCGACITYSEEKDAERAIHEAKANPAFIDTIVKIAYAHYQPGMRLKDQNAMVYICGKGLTKDLLLVELSKFSGMKSVSISENTGTAFISFSTMKEAETAMNQLSVKSINGLPLLVRLTHPKSDRLERTNATTSVPINFVDDQCNVSFTPGKSDVEAVGSAVYETGEHSLLDKG